MSYDDKYLISLIKLNQEKRFLEYKQSENWESIKYNIAKSSLAMSNLRDGGYIIIGIKEEVNNTFTPTGLKEEHIKTYKYDDIQDFINKYADPQITLDFAMILYEGKKFIFIIINEFDEVPIICKRDGPNSIMKKGTIYIRPQGKPQSCPVQTQTEMREIIELYGEKNFKKHITFLQHVNLFKSEDVKSNDASLFLKQVDGL